MAVFNYRKFKISLEKNSKATQGLKTGDIVRRQYFDGTNVVYSLLCVLSYGVEQVEEGTQSYFIGALLEGDVPQNAELLDFVRITNLFDLERSGALYLTASDDEAPYMDVIDGLGRNKSLSWPESIASEEFQDPKTQYVLQNPSLVSSEYIRAILDNSRVCHITRNSTPGIDVGIRQDFYEYVESPQCVLISYKIKASADISGVASLEYADGVRVDGSVHITASTDWEYKFHAITVGYSGRHIRTAKLSFPSLESNQEVWIADFNVILLSSVAVFSDASAIRVGKLNGVIDPVFGRLDGYGGYFEKMYASKSAHISGTLTAGDENGFGATFYAGKINRNRFVNSLEIPFAGSLTPSTEIINPVGIGDVYKLGTNASLVAQTAEWLQDHVKAKYTFSFWAFAKNPCTIGISQNNIRIATVNIGEGELFAWSRRSVTFFLQEPELDTDDLQFSFVATFSDVSQDIITGETAPDFEDAWFIVAPQLESGEIVTQYQATDSVLSEAEDYGAWFARGGIGGTIQNPLLQLNYDGEGSIGTRTRAFLIRTDGSGYLAKTNILWNEDGDVTFGEGVVVNWNNLDQTTKGKIDRDWIVDWDTRKTQIAGEYILTPKIYAGTVEVIGGVKKVTGVYMGPDTAGAGLYGYVAGTEIFHLNSVGGLIGGWTINANDITSPGGKLKLLSAGTIAAFNNSNNVIWGLYENGNATFANGNILFNADGSAHYEGEIEAASGLIGGWTIAQRALWKPHVILDSTNSYIGISPYALTAENVADGTYLHRDSVHNSGGVSIFWDSALSYGLEGYLPAINGVQQPVFLLGSVNKLAGWNFDVDSIYSGTKVNVKRSNTSGNAITIGSNGMRGSTWYIDVDGQFSFASGKFAYNGSVTSLVGWAMGENRLSAKYAALLSGESLSGLFLSTQDISDIASANLLPTIAANTGIYMRSLTNVADLAGYVGGKLVFRVGSEGNKIGGWNFTDTSLYSVSDAVNNGFSTGTNALVFDANGIHANHWKLMADGSGQLGDNNIIWNANGAGSLANGNIAWTNLGAISIANGATIFGTDGSGSTANGKFTWDEDGAGFLADGNIAWDEDGHITFGENITIGSSDETLATLLNFALSFSQMFEKDTTSISGQTLIKAKYALYSVGEITAGGVGSGGSGGVNYLYQLEDVPDYRTAYRGKYLRVKSDGSGTEWVDVTGGVSSVISLTGDITQSQLRTALGLGSLAYLNGLSKGDVGLGNVDNTADANKLVYGILTSNTLQGGASCYDASPGLHFYRYNGDDNTIGGGDGWILQWSWNQGSVGGQIYLDDNPSKTIGIRGRKTDSSFTSWSKIALTSDIPTQLPNPYSLTFGSKTYNGSAAQEITKSDLGLGNVENKSSATIRSEIVATNIPALDASKITTGQFADARIASASAWNNKWDYNENTIKAVKVNNAGNADNADTVDSLHANSFAQWKTYSSPDVAYDFGWGKIAGGSGSPTGAQYGQFLTMPYRKATGNTTPDFAWQIFGPNGDDSTNPDDIFVRTSIATSWRTWHKLYHSGNCNNASTPWSCSNLTASGNGIFYGNVGIGTISPSRKLSISGGSIDIAANVSSVSDTGVFVTNTANSRQIQFIEGTSGKMGIYCPHNGWNLYTNTDNTVHLGQQTYCDSNFIATGEVTAGGSSDIRFKNNVRPYKNAIKKIMSLRPVEFDWNDLATSLYSVNKGHSFGLIAQEVQSVIPEVVSPIFEEYLRVDYGKLSTLCIAGIQEHETRIERLERENKELRQQIQRLQHNS